jgi:hypothetical protein
MQHLYRALFNVQAVRPMNLVFLVLLCRFFAEIDAKGKGGDSLPDDSALNFWGRLLDLAMPVTLPTREVCNFSYFITDKPLLIGTTLLHAKLDFVKGKS